MFRVATHTFRSITPGEHCIGENCTGVRSLVELTRLDGMLQAMEPDISHTGTLTNTEIQEIHEARMKLDEIMQKAFA